MCVIIGHNYGINTSNYYPNDNATLNAAKQLKSIGGRKAKDVIEMENTTFDYGAFKTTNMKKKRRKKHHSVKSTSKARLQHR